MVAVNLEFDSCYNETESYNDTRAKLLENETWIFTFSAKEVVLYRLLCGKIADCFN